MRNLKTSYNVIEVPQGPGIYRNAQLGVISLSSDGTNWLTIADKNLGATQVYNDGDVLSEANCGKYYQWGNNYGFPFTGAVTTSSSQVNAGSYGPLTYYSSSTFIKGVYNWSSNQNDNLWGDTTNTSDARKGPCDEGYHIPSSTEFGGLMSAMTSLRLGNYMEYYYKLKIPHTGYRSYSNASAQYQGSRAYLWSTSPAPGIGNEYAYNLLIESNGVSSGASKRADGLFIRPFANTPTAPDENWTVLYQGTGDAGIYHNATLGLISISSDGTNWITIADKNLGATQVYNDGDTLSEANCGKYYQWGNNYGFPFSGSVTTSSTQVSTVGYGGIGYYSSSTFITRSGSPYDWSSVQNDNLWGSYGDMLTKKGPCGDGYHVPTSTEWQNLYDIGVSISAWTSSGGNNFKTYIKIPFAGFRDRSNANVSSQGIIGMYWSSTAYSTDSAHNLDLYSSHIYPQQGGFHRSNAYSIRPFANTPIQPDSSWEKLY